MTTPKLVWIAWLLGILAYAVVGALLASRKTRAVAVVWASAGAVAVVFAPADPPLMKATCCLLYGWVGWVRVVETALSRPLPATVRVWQTLAVFDVRRAKYGPRRFNYVRFAEVLLSAVAAVACGVTAAGQSLDAGPEHILARYALGAGQVYFTVQAFMSLLDFIYQCVGIYPPRLHQHPILSRTVVEFWGQRWNQVVGAWLRSAVFAPLARKRGSATAMLGTFVASAALHTYFVAPALGWKLGSLMGAFFLVQAVAVWAERALRVNRWRPSLARAWTVAVIVGSSPLFVEPFLRVFSP